MIGQFEIAKMDEYGVPGYMQDGLTSYFNDHRAPGGFLTAVLENDLMGAFSKADMTNERALHSYAKWLFNHANVGAFGSPEKVKAWLENREAA